MQKFQNYKGLRQDDRRQACVPGTRQIPWSEYDPLHSPGLLFGQLTGWTVLLLSRQLLGIDDTALFPSSEVDSMLNKIKNDKMTLTRTTV